MVNDAEIRNERRQAAGVRRDPRLLKLVAMLGALVMLGGCGNAATGNGAAGLMKSSVAPAPEASIKSMAVGDWFDTIGTIAGLASAISSTVAEEQAQAEFVAIGGQLTEVQSQLAAIQAAQQQDFADLLEAVDIQTYDIAVEAAVNSWVVDINGALNELENMVAEGQKPSPNPDLMKDYVQDFTNYVNEGNLNEAGNALVNDLIYNSGTSAPSIWGLAWQAIRQSQSTQFKNTLLTSNSSAQVQAMSNGWLGIMASLQLVLTNYWNMIETPPDSVPTAASKAAAANEITASGIASQIQALQAAQPKLIPNYTLIDPSTNIMWATFGQLPWEVNCGPIGFGYVCNNNPPTSTNAAGEQTGLGNLLNQVNGSETLAQGGWANFPVGVPGQGSGPAGSGLQINTWSFPNVYFWEMPEVNDESFTEHAGVQFGGSGVATGLESQLNGVEAGQPMSNALQSVTNPSMFPFQNEGCEQWLSDLGWTTAPMVWVNSNNGYEQMLPNGQSFQGNTPQGVVGNAGSADYTEDDCYASVTLITIVKAADYQWVPQKQ